MLINLLFENPIYFFVVAVVVVVALTVHEFAHAVAATSLGDPTAKQEGRLTLNPASHLSLLGSVFLLFVGFGWGKPVPFNPYNLRLQKWGPAIVAVAGPFSNLILAIIFGLSLRVISHYSLFSPDNLLVIFLYFSVLLNISLMFFNLLPLAPLDGSKILFAFISDYKFAKLRQVLETQGTFILISLVFLESFSGLNVFGSFFSVIQEWISHLVF